MNFVQFCEAHGILVDRLPRIGVWERFPTSSHPHRRNGAVKYMGDYGFVVDHANHTETQLWKADQPVRVSPREVREAIRKAAEERERLAQAAAMKASAIINQCVIGKNEYLARKGFPDERGLLHYKDRQEFLIIPMRDQTNTLVGMQAIDEEGGKKFLYGQKTSGANFVIGRRGLNVLCEGYATGLSVREAARHLKIEMRIVVCFSANNLVTISKLLKPGIVVADHDKSCAGERAAQATGWPFWMSTKVGEDFNDHHQRAGLFQSAASLWRLLYPASRGQVERVKSLREAIRARQLIDQ